MVLMVYTLQVLVVNPCGADGTLCSRPGITLVVLMVYTLQSIQVLVVNPCGANGLHSLHSAVDQVLVVNPWLWC